MIVEQRYWRKSTGWIIERPFPENTMDRDDPLLVLVFGDRILLEQANLYEEMMTLYPLAQVVFCSTAGEVSNTNVLEHAIVVTAIKFEHTRICAEEITLSSVKDAYHAGSLLAKSLMKSDGLKHILVISDGGTVNGTDLCSGLNQSLPEHITISGGLAGDGHRFERTLTGLNEAPSTGNIIGIGLYGDRIHLGLGCAGGWTPFGPRRKITRSKGNVLFELDGESALGLYKKYLGNKSKELPASALLFPLSIEIENAEQGLVRTVLSIDEEAQSMTFAGDMPEGSIVRLMKSNMDKVIDGAFEAASLAKSQLDPQTQEIELALLISCCGRKWLLDQSIDDEIESIREVTGAAPLFTGFYSYGEIAPFTNSKASLLHNQTMTITFLSEH